jgi:hypothetical protein
MKRKLTLVLAIVITLSIILSVVWIIYRDIENKAWAEYTESSIVNLAEYLEIYKNGHDRYPASLSDMLRDPDFATNELLNSMASAEAGTRYSYTTSGGIILISAVRPKTLFSGEKKIIKSYRPAEADRIKVLQNPVK